jgi:hypothetical protein
MREDITDDLLIFDEADDPHGPLTMRTDQRINLVYFLNQPRPLFLKLSHFPPVREYRGWHRLSQFLFVFPVRHYCNTRSIDHLLAPLGYANTCRQPFQSGKVLTCPPSLDE